MEAHTRRPAPMKIHGEMDKNWRSWKEDFKIFIKASGLTNKSSPEKASLLLNLIGKKGREATEDLSSMEKDSFERLMMKLDEYFDPPKTEKTLRNEFFTRAKKQEENINEYILDLQQKAENCNFGELSESLIQDVIILHTKDVILKKRFLEDKTLTMSKIIEYYNYYEDTQKMKKEILAEAQKETEKLASKNQRMKKEILAETQKETEKLVNRNQKMKTEMSLSEGQNESIAERLANKRCWRCKTSHPIRQCPAWNKKCVKCGELHHFPISCPKFRPQTGTPHSKPNTSHNENPLPSLMQLHNIPTPLWTYPKEQLNSVTVRDTCSDASKLNLNAREEVIANPINVSPQQFPSVQKWGSQSRTDSNLSKNGSKKKDNSECLLM